jgi:hypothetical protein
MSKRRDEVVVPVTPLQVAVRPEVAAALLDVSDSTFARYVRPHLRQLWIGDSPRFTIAELSRWSEENSQKPLD